MTDRRRGLGRGLGALIPPAPTGVDRPRDVFFPRQTSVSAGQSAAMALLDKSVDESSDVADLQTGGPRDVDQPAVDQAAVDQVVVDQVRVDDQGVASSGGDTAQDVATEQDQDLATEQDLEQVPGARFAELPVEQIVANPRQPRQVFDEDELAELEHSIREIGVLQPVVVRAVASGYELIMGERRLRATRNVGLTTIPAIIRDTGDEDMLRDALLENLHRAQLNPLEEAAAYQQLLEDFGCTHEELATRIGRSRPQISNTLRLMKLPPLVQRRVAAGVLSAGHARALLGLSDGAAMERLAQRIVAEGLSVRSVEEIVLLGEGGEPAKKRPSGPRETQPELEDHAARLADRLDTRVAIAMGKRKGRMTVEFASLEDLERILGLLGSE
ncbi:ParB/RepB/Spo0J family partition protein [Ornithinimicrobium sp. F0845]|uniref:ParB/RepB/Spo0J family partition protein n=1 Tax=Ornithinimicrobium sp. F0845 TaxID=2926412 RepID=UPI001FF34680|nr:ParB/RepB/Spo0J family partition protein [Ornithinimicrobium sp. F0845]MCK0113484.1 ParB/RepB/Spo0J family partition protein [Ornithinimicrobium sp. F0845]